VIRPAALLLAVGALALGAAGCGGDDEPEASATATWADELCTAVSDWVADLRRIGDDVTDPSSLSLARLEEAAGDVGSATDAFLDDVRDLGSPETEAGDEARAALEALADTIEAEKEEIEDAIDSASGLTGITSAVSTIASSLTTMGEEFERTFDQLGELDASGELEQAFEQADACDEFDSE